MLDAFPSRWHVVRSNSPCRRSHHRSSTLAQDPRVRAAILDSYRHCRNPCAEADGYNSLTEREREVLQLVVEGRTNNEIAGLLSMRVTTVETHRTNILRKLDVHSTAKLVLFAVRHGVMS